MRRISREAEKTIFLSTHDVELALQLADTLWLMSKTSPSTGSGTVEGSGPMAIGSPKELAASGDLGRFIEGGRQTAGDCPIVFDKETLTIKVNPSCVPSVASGKAERDRLRDREKVKK